MGCIQSKKAEEPNSRKSTLAGGAGQAEERIELLFKAKRQNVFTTGIDKDQDFKPKYFSKTDSQKAAISKFLI